MRSRVAREFGAKRIEPLAGGGLDQVLGAPARDKRGTVALANDPLDPRCSLAELSVEDACLVHRKSQDAGGFGHAGEDQPTAFAFGNELTGPFPPSHRAALIVSDLGKAMVFLPFAEILLPSRRERAELATDKASDTTLRIVRSSNRKGARPFEFPKARGVGDERPNRRQRLGEKGFAPEAVDGAILCPHAALPRPDGGADRPTGAACSAIVSGATNMDGRQTAQSEWSSGGPLAASRSNQNSQSSSL